MSRMTEADYGDNLNIEKALKEERLLEKLETENPPKTAETVLHRARTNDDEPVFVLRAKDNLALAALGKYCNDLEAAGFEDTEFYADVLNHVADFVRWRAKHKDQCKNPD